MTSLNLKFKLIYNLFFLIIAFAKAQLVDTVSNVTLHNEPIITNDSTKSNSEIYYDLIITELKVELCKKHQIGNIKLSRIIKYTIKNTGANYVKLADVWLQGYLSNDSSFRPENIIPTGGDWAKKSKFVLAKDESYSSYFICDYNTFWDEKLYFLLKVDTQNVIPETNETNNTIVIQVNFIKEHQ